MVSIVIPYYNRPTKLQRALDSIREQSYKDFEIIIIDDASDVPFEGFLSEKTNYIKCKENKGPGACRNIGFNNAKGKYIVFLDSDDFWHKDFLLKTINALKSNSNNIMAYCKGYNVDENETIIEERRINSIKPSVILPHILQFGRPWGTGACIWNKKKIETIKWIETRYWEDYTFDVSAAIICNDIIVVKEYLIFYDISGVDKLSKNITKTSIKEKNKSLRTISNEIQKSSFFHDVVIKREIVKHILNNTIELLSFKIKEREYYSGNISIIKSYKGGFISVLVCIFTKINSYVGLKLLRRLRTKIINKGIK